MTQFTLTETKMRENCDCKRLKNNADFNLFCQGDPNPPEPTRTRPKKSDFQNKAGKSTAEVQFKKKKIFF